MGEFLKSFKDEASLLLRNKKNLAGLLILGILILAVPVGIDLIRHQQIIKSRAAADPIVFTGPNVVQRDGEWKAVKPQISLELTSPLGPPGTVSPSSSPTP